MNEQSHIPVLLEEVIDLLNLQTMPAGRQEGMNVVDCTLGLGGHSLEILKKIGAKGKLMAFDQDEKNLKIAKSRIKLEPITNTLQPKVILVNANFEQLKEKIKEYKFPAPDAILFDLGLSSPHVDMPERGFSFQKEGPLDMRYDQNQQLTAEIVVNSYKEKDLADIIYKYGEERRSRPIARKILEARKKKRITTTLELADILASTIKGYPVRTGHPGRQKHHPATKTFQALRIYVNRELEVLENVLHQAIDVIAPKGRIAVISYHSLEDRIVKNIFRYYTKNCICPKELPVCQCNFEKKLYLLTKRPIIPTGIEVEKNPRSRSAKLRVAEKL